MVSYSSHSDCYCIQLQTSLQADQSWQSTQMRIDPYDHIFAFTLHSHDSQHTLTYVNSYSMGYFKVSGLVLKDSCLPCIWSAKYTKWNFEWTEKHDFTVKQDCPWCTWFDCNITSDDMTDRTDTWSSMRNKCFEVGDSMEFNSKQIFLNCACSACPRMLPMLAIQIMQIALSSDFSFDLTQSITKL